MRTNKIGAFLLAVVMFLSSFLGNVGMYNVFAESPESIKVKVKYDDGDVTGLGNGEVWLVEDEQKTQKLSYSWSYAEKAYVGEFKDLDPTKEYTIEASEITIGRDFLYKYAKFNKWYSCSYDAKVEGSPEEGYTVTYTLMTDINGTVSFKDGEYPEEITVNLIKEGEIIESVVTNAAKDWKFDFGTRIKVDNGSEIMYNVSVDDIPGHYHRTTGYDIEVVPTSKITLTKELVGTSNEEEFGVYIIPNYRSYEGLWIQKIEARYPMGIAWIGYKMAHQVIEGAKRWDKISGEEPIYPVVSTIFEEEHTATMLEKIRANGGSMGNSEFTVEEAEKGTAFVGMIKEWPVLEGEHKYDVTVEGTNVDPELLDRDANLAAGRSRSSCWELMMYAPFNEGENWGVDPDGYGISQEALSEMLAMAYPGDELTDFREYIDRQVRNKLYYYTTIKPGETEVVELPIEHLYSLIIVEKDHADTTEPEAINIVNLDRTAYPRDTEEELAPLRIGDYSATLKNVGKTTKDIKLTKEWIDEDESLRPDCIVVQLLVNGKQHNYHPAMLLRKQENYGMTWKNLPMYDSNGDEITYSIKELYAGEGYQLKEIKETDEGFTLINEYNPKKTKITLSKELIGESNKDEFGIYLMPYPTNTMRGFFAKFCSWYPYTACRETVGCISEFLSAVKEYDKTAEIKLHPLFSKLFDEDFINEMKQLVESKPSAKDSDTFNEEQKEKILKMAAYFFSYSDKSSMTYALTALDPDFYNNNGVDDFQHKLENFKHGGLYNFKDYYEDESHVKSYGYEDFQDYIDRAILNNRVFYYTIKAGETKTIEIPNELVHLVIIEEDSEDIEEFEPIYSGPFTMSKEIIIADEPKSEFEYKLVNKGKEPEPEIPEVKTSAAAENGNALKPETDQTIIDTVELTGLIPGTKYTITGKLMVKEGEGVEVTTYNCDDVTFIAKEDAETHDVTFSGIDATNLGGKELVVFETLTWEGNIHGTTDDNGTFTYKNESKHENINDVAQTVPVKEPEVIETIDIPVEKVWDDSDNKEGLRPTSVKVNLLANGKLAESVTLNADNEWKHTFTGLNVKDGETKDDIIYTVEEESVDKYEAEITGDIGSGFVVTNKRNVELISVSGKKTWNDSDNQDGKRPESIIVNLLENGTEVDELVVNADNDWSYEFTNLPKYKNGAEVVYSITEDEVTGYQTVISGYNIENTYTPELTAVNVEKVWDDKDNKDELRLDSITVTLLADGVETDSIELSVDNEWKHSFIDLPKFAEGKEIVYTVEENEVPEGYTKEITGSKTSFVIKNTHTPTEPEPEVEPEVVISKTDATTKEELPGAKLIVTKANTGEEVASWTSTTEPKKIKLSEGEYILTEITAPNGYEIAESISFTVNKDGLVGSDKVVMEDAPTPKVEISKVDATTKEELPGAKLVVTNADTGEEVISWTSTTQSKKIILKPGNYILTEITAPDGYEVAESIEFSVDINGLVGSKKVVMEDAPKIEKLNEVLISKVDATTSKELPGAKLVVTDKATGKEIVSWVSENEPKKIRLIPGNYILTEITAPDGYEVAESIEFNVDENGLVGSDKVEMRDAPKPKDTPKPESRIPSLATTVTAGDVKAGEYGAIITEDIAKNGVSVVDEVRYKDLIVGGRYVLEGTLVKVDGSDITEVATALKECIAEGREGVWMLEFGNVTLEAGAKYVVFESAYSADGKDVLATKEAPIEHKDIDDMAQTIIVDRNEEVAPDNTDAKPEPKEEVVTKDTPNTTRTTITPTPVIETNRITRQTAGVNTGDTNNILLYVGIILVSGITITTIFLKKKKR